MKIWIVKDGEPVPGFDETARMMRAVNLAEYFSKLGHEVIWWTSTWSHYKKKKYVEKNHSYHVNPNFEIRMLDCVGYKKNVSFRRIFHYSQLARKFAKQAHSMAKPDLIISSLPAVEFSFAAVNYASKVGCPILVDCRDMWPDIMVEVFPKPLRPFARIAAHYQFVMMKSLCRRASGFIGITEPYVKWAAKYAGREVSHKDTVLPLVSDNFSQLTEENTDNCETFFNNLGVKFVDKFNVVFAGNYSRKTANLTPVIEAFKKLPEQYQLLIAGSAAGDEELEKEYRELAKDIPNVHFLGWLNSQQLNYLYKHAQLAVAPYVNKTYFSMNLTNKPIEYLYYGLPILTSVKGYLSELLKQYEIGYYYNDMDVDQITKTIEMLGNDQHLQNSMSKKCKQLHEEKFDYHQVMQSFMNHLNRNFQISEKA